MIYMLQDKTFPFRTANGRIKDDNKNYWKISTNIDSRVATGELNLETLKHDNSPYTGWLIPCNRSLVANKTSHPHRKTSGTQRTD